MTSDPSHMSLVARHVRQRLRCSAWLALRSLECQADGRAVTLAGEVPTLYTKQVALALAQRAARHVAPEASVVDRITVA